MAFEPHIAGDVKPTHAFFSLARFFSRASHGSTHDKFTHLSQEKEIPTSGYRRIMKNNPLVISDFRMTNYDLGNSRAGARGGGA